MTSLQISRLLELAAKGATLTDAEQTEYTALTADSDITEADLKKIVADTTKAAVAEALKNVRTRSRMEFSEEGSEISLPIAHRSGNLAVCEKQLLNICTKKSMDEGIPESLLKDADTRGEMAEKRLIQRLGRKDFTMGGTGAGSDFMNFSLSSNLYQRLYLASELAQRMAAQEIQMPTSPFSLPLATTRPRFYSGIAELAAPTGSNPGTARPTLTAAKLMGMIPLSDEADDDSVIAVLPLMMKQLGDAAAEAYEDCLLNGDVSGTQDNDGATGDPLRVFDGIRKLVLAQAALKVSLATGGISAANIGALRKALGKWGIQPKDLLLVAGPKGYQDLVMLPETLTSEKVGGRDLARILTGVAPSIFGIPIVCSAHNREDLTAAAIYDTGGIHTQGSILLIHLPSWIPGVRRGFTVEVFRDPRVGGQWVCAAFRRAFIPIESLANSKAACLGYAYAA
jgi:HK97 family phage major capsid protein